MIQAIPLARPWRSKPVILQFCLDAVNRACDGKVRFVQVGAHDGTLADPVVSYTTSGDWTGVMVEPHPVYFADLCRVHGERTGMTLVNCAVSEEEGSFELYHLTEAERPNYPDWARGCASMKRERLEEALAGRRLDETPTVPERDITGVTVAARRLDAILADAGVSTADLLVVDVEGWELSVLRSVDLGALALTAALVECNASDRGQEGEVAALFAAHGFETFRIRDDLLALHPERAQVPIADMLKLLGQPHVPPTPE